MPFGFGPHNPNAPPRPWWERLLIGLAGATPLGPAGSVGANYLFNGVDRRRQDRLNQQNGQPTYGAPGWSMGSPGTGFNNGQLGNPYGGFGGGYGLNGSGYGSTGNASYGSGLGFGNGLGALPGSTGTDQFGLPTGPVNLQNPSSPSAPPPNNGLGSLGQTNANPHFGEYDRQMAENNWENGGFSLNTRSGADALMRRYQQ